MKKKILFSLLCLMSVTTLVNAQESYENKAPWNTILKNGVLHINGKMPTGENNDQNNYQVYQLLNEQYKEEITAASTRKQGEDHIIVKQCYDVFATCELDYVSCEFEGECDHTPVVAQMMWEESAKDSLEQLAPNGILTLNATKASLVEKEMPEFTVLVYKLLEEMGYENVWATDWNEDRTSCMLSINGDGVTETKNVKVVYQDEKEDVKKVVDNYTTRLKQNINSPIEISDLRMLKLIIYTSSETRTQDILQKLVDEVNKDEHIKVDILGFPYGVETNFINNDTRMIRIYYDDTLVDVIDATIHYSNILYIPSETENTPDAYIAAAMKKIDEYFGVHGIEFFQAVKISELSEDTRDNELEGIDLSLTGEYTYDCDIEGFGHRFLIMRDSSKTEVNEETITNRDTNIKVSYTSSEVPVDTILKVEEVAKDQDVFKRVIKGLLKIGEKEEVQVYDITLFSEKENKYITKLENGEFKVSVPVKESLRGKKLVAYYITEDNKIEEHPVTEKDGIGTFTTNHFSVYTIAEARKMENGVVVEVPKTYDGIMNSIMLGVVGLVGLATAIVVYKKREN